MGNRKRNSKRPVNIQPAGFKIGDSVVIKAGVNDPEYEVIKPRIKTLSRHSLSGLSAPPSPCLLFLNQLIAYQLRSNFHRQLGAY